MVGVGVALGELALFLQLDQEEEVAAEVVEAAEVVVEEAQVLSQDHFVLPNEKAGCYFKVFGKIVSRKTDWHLSEECAILPTSSPYLTPSVYRFLWTLALFTLAF